MILDIRDCLSLIAAVEMLSHGETAAWDSSGGGHSAEKANPLPPGESNPPHLWLRAELEKANTQRQVDSVAQKARTVLHRARYSRRNDAEVVYGTREWRAAIANDSRATDVVAQDYGISAGHVHRLRRLHKQEAA